MNQFYLHEVHILKGLMTRRQIYQMVTSARKNNKAGERNTERQEGAILDWVTNEHSLLR